MLRMIAGYRGWPIVHQNDPTVEPDTKKKRRRKKKLLSRVGGSNHGAPPVNIMKNKT